ncbi:MAG: response regulator [Planctomycetales bacterium]|nr:response regulator [Planctomycetales bacterium]
MDTLILPLEDEQTVESRKRILIVDDDHSQADVLSFRLSKQGYATQTAYSGRDGMAAARENRPDAILMDIRLPDANGLNLCQSLSEDPRTCGIPVIILSGMERPDIIRRSREAGCQYFVRKPYDPNALLLLVESALDFTSP